MDVARTCLDLPLEISYFLEAVVDFLCQVFDDAALPRQQILQRTGRAFEIALVYYTGIVEALERLRGRVRCILKRICIIYFTLGNRQLATLATCGSRVHPCCSPCCNRQPISKADDSTKYRYFRRHSIRPSQWSVLRWLFIRALLDLQ